VDGDPPSGDHRFTRRLAGDLDILERETPPGIARERFDAHLPAERRRQSDNRHLPRAHCKRRNRPGQQSDQDGDGDERSQEHRDGACAHA
jgi:hypothetical protein